MVESTRNRRCIKRGDRNRCGGTTTATTCAEYRNDETDEKGGFEVTVHGEDLRAE
jgi:hypothetical protein